MSRIITETFFLLEGQLHNGQSVAIAVGFDKEEMIGLAQSVALNNPDIFVAIKVSEQGDWLRVEDVPQPTHEAPIRPV